MPEGDGWESNQLIRSSWFGERGTCWMQKQISAGRAKKILWGLRDTQYCKEKGNKRDSVGGRSSSLLTRRDALCSFTTSWSRPLCCLHRIPHTKARVQQAIGRAWLEPAGLDLVHRGRGGQGGGHFSGQSVRVVSQVHCGGACKEGSSRTETPLLRSCRPDSHEAGHPTQAVQWQQRTTPAPASNVPCQPSLPLPRRQAPTCHVRHCHAGAAGVAVALVVYHLAAGGAAAGRENVHALGAGEGGRALGEKAREPGPAQRQHVRASCHRAPAQPSVAKHPLCPCMQPSPAQKCPCRARCWTTCICLQHRLRAGCGSSWR